MMNDKQLRRVIASLSLLAKTGDVPIDALGVLSVCPGEKLADHLHQKWLSDESFYRLPAIILEHLHKYNVFKMCSISTVQYKQADESDGNLMSCCLMHLLSDFRARETIRKASSLMFRNSVKVLTELYAVYRRIDEVLSECLIVPVFASLQMLAEKEASEEDVQVWIIMLLDPENLLCPVTMKLLG
uniref:Serine/threonine-protein kinase ATR n=1 Tax=Syphacia muris TaxID=451379 RepID=A0A0N5AL30_9BILA